METREGPPVDPALDYRPSSVPPNSYPGEQARQGPVESSEFRKESESTGKSSVPVSRPPLAPSAAAAVTTSAGRILPLPPKPTLGKNLQSVVTTSFSVEDANNSPGRYHLSTERVETRESPPEWRQARSSEERSPPSRPPSAIVLAATSPRSYLEKRHVRTHPIARSYSSTTSDSYNSLPMKRNFFHHASHHQSYVGLPPDFIPPKRTKGSGHHRSNDIILEARIERDVGGRQWYSPPPPPPHWEPHYRERSGYGEEPMPHSRSQSFPAHRWMEQKSASSTHSYHYGHYNPALPVAAYRESSQESWRHPSWYAEHPPRHHWGPSLQVEQGRDDIEYSHSRAIHQEMRESFDDESRDSSTIGYNNSNRNAIFRKSSASSSFRNSGDKMQLVVEAASFTEGRTDLSSNSTKPCYVQQGGLPQGTLLAMPGDKSSLSETLCIVRENVEVFQATQADVDAPAPGRKHAIAVGQVGLRCIHCRHTKKASERVKRAVCYPSSLKRIYRTVIDMKLDHFSQCKYVPFNLKQRLDDLKSVHTRSTGTTMQYFIKSAKALGMEDAPSGVRLNKSIIPQAISNLKPNAESMPYMMYESTPKLPQASVVKVMKSESTDSSVSSMDISKRNDSMGSGGSYEANDVSVMNGRFYDGMVPLALPEDSSALSPLRCFLREQVCAFAATENDISFRAPTTFSIGLGQVGIGCIHCVKKHASLRSNRAVCFPFSIGRIYQSVADIQRFHLSECKNLPSDIREKFLFLQNASSKGSKGLATRQYWVDSAKKLGLVDTSKGIRFGRDPAKPLSSPSFSLDILAQAAISVTTTSKKLVLPEDKDTIAEFLYLVMEQLQPCRFTEADRNKRRLKDVGCIGVECKHCAGQVDSRKFFWSSVSAVESNFVSVHSHMFECRMVPQSLKDKLTELKQLRKEQTAKLMSGSQKAFFRRVWERLHEEEPTDASMNEAVTSMSQDSADEITNKAEI